MHFAGAKKKMPTTAADSVAAWVNDRFVEKWHWFSGGEANEWRARYIPRAVDKVLKNRFIPSRTVFIFLFS